MGTFTQRLRAGLGVVAIAGVTAATFFAPAARADGNPLTMSQSVSPQVVPPSGGNVTYTVTIKNSSPDTAYNITAFSGDPCPKWDVVSGSKEQIQPGGTLVMKCSMFATITVVNKFNMSFRRVKNDATGSSTSAPTTVVTAGSTQIPTLRPVATSTTAPSATRPGTIISREPSMIVVTPVATNSQPRPTMSPTSNPRPTSQAPSGRPGGSNGADDTVVNRPGGEDLGGGFDSIFSGGGFMSFFAKIIAWFQSIFGGMGG